MTISILLATLCAYCIWFSWPLIPLAGDSARLVAVFDSDEAHHMELTRLALEHKSMNIDFHGYGHLYFNVVLLPLLLIQAMTPVSDEMIIVAFRVVSTASLMLTILATFALARRFFGAVGAIVAATLVALVPLSLIRLSAISHPDTLQAFLVVMSLYYCCDFAQSLSVKSLVKGSIWAGLSFSTKYSGLFLVPIIVALLPFRIGQPGYALRRAIPARLLRWGIALSGVLALAVALGFTPQFVNLRFSPTHALNASQLSSLHFARQITFAGGVVLFLLGALPWIWRALRERRRLLVLLAEYCQLGGFFLLAFAATSPFLLVKLRVVKGLMAESLHVSFGHGFAANANALEWFQVLGSGEVFGIIVGASAAMALLSGVVRALRSRKFVLQPQLVLWGWTVFYLTYLFIRVSYREPRYLLPIVPMVMILVCAQAAEWLKQLHGMNSRLVTRAGIAVVVISLGSAMAAGISRAHIYRDGKLQEFASSREVEAGDWLSTNYRSEARIAYDPYSYIPPQFETVKRMWQWSIGDRDRFGPDVIVTHAKVRSRYSNSDDAKAYYHGVSKFQELQSYYLALLREEKFTLVQEFGPVNIYERNSP